MTKQELILTHLKTKASMLQKLRTSTLTQLPSSTGANQFNIPVFFNSSIFILDCRDTAFLPMGSSINFKYCISQYFFHSCKVFAQIHKFLPCLNLKFRTLVSVSRSFHIVHMQTFTAKINLWEFHLMKGWNS